MSCSHPCPPQANEPSPLMVCLGCGHTQTFDAGLVHQGRAVGDCDQCGPKRGWMRAWPKLKLPATVKGN